MKTVLQTLGQAILLSALAMFTTGFVIAHPGHGDPISKDAAVQRASAQITRLVDAGKLEKSWKLKAALYRVESRGTGNRKEWVVLFTNPDAAQATERTLHVFLTDQGEYLAANFTGR